MSAQPSEPWSRAESRRDAAAQQADHNDAMAAEGRDHNDWPDDEQPTRAELAREEFERQQARWDEWNA